MDLKNFPVCPEPQCYIYLFLNNAGKVKIGKTTDIYKRYLSLCGSNGQGIPINKCYISPMTFLFPMEKTMHNKFHSYRIPNTEWFYDESDPTGEILFDNMVIYMELLFSSASYKKCNELRKQIWNKGGDVCDD